MPKKKLTAKLKASLKKDYRKVKKADYSGEALAYLNRVRAAHKGVKTKAKRKVYYEKQKRRKSVVAHPMDYVKAIAKNKGLSLAQYKKKFPKSYKDFTSSSFTTSGNMDVDNLITEIGLKASGAKLNGKKVKREILMNALSRMKHRIVSTGMTYERITIRYSIDFKGNYILTVPMYEDTKGMEPDEMLDHIKDEFPEVIFHNKNGPK